MSKRQRPSRRFAATLLLAASLCAIGVVGAATFSHEKSASAQNTALFNNILGPPNGGGGPNTITFSNSLAKSFVPTQSGAARSMSFWVSCFNFNCEGAGNLEIRTDAGGQPSSTVLGAVEWIVQAPQLGGNPTCVGLGVPANLTSGTTYWAVMNRTSGSASWFFTTGNPDTPVESPTGEAPWTTVPGNLQKTLSLRIDDVACGGVAEYNPASGTTVGPIVARPLQRNSTSVTIKNIGNTGLTATGAVITGPDASAFSLWDVEAANIALGSQLRFPRDITSNTTMIGHVHCRPPTAGTFSADLTISADDGTSATWPLECFGDNMPPEISVGPPPDGANSWYTSDPLALSITATDMSGVKRIQCTDSLGSPPIDVPASAAPFNLIGPGIHAVSCSATDVAGNTGNASVEIRVDATPPQISATIEPAPNAAGWNKTNVDVSFTCADPTPGSGIDVNTLGTNTQTLTEQTAGTDVTNTGECIDNAGLSALAATPTIKIDKELPVITPTADPKPNEAGWHASDVTVTFPCADALSGVAQVTTSDVTITDNTAGRTVGTGGSCIDVAGNEAEPETIDVKLDKDLPVIAASITPMANAAGWHNTDVTVGFDCTDVGPSGVATNTVAGEMVTSDVVSKTVQNTGTCIDRADNQAIAASVTINLDKTPPSLTLPGDITQRATNGQIGAAVFYNVVSSDTGGSGLAVASCDIPSGSVFAPGQTTVTCSATDVADNTTTDTFTVTITTNVVLVAGNAGPPSGDRPIVALADRIFDDVIIIDDDTPDLATAVMDRTPSLILLSSSVVPSKVGDSLKDLAVPIVSWEGYLYDDLGFNAALPGKNGATSTSQTALTIVDPSQQMSAGFSGSQTVTTAASQFAFSRSEGAAQVVAKAGGADVIFGYEEGAPMAGATVAPARRVGLFMDYATPRTLTPVGESLVLAAMGWAIGESQPENTAPRVEAGETQTVRSIGAVTVDLDATVNDDGRPVPPGTVTTQWAAATAGVEFADPTATDTAVTLPGPGTYALTLSASDGDLMASDTVTITVELPPNMAPTAEAGPSQTITLPTTSANLAGEVSDDGLPTPAVTTTWSQDSGPAGVTFDDADSLNATASFPTAGQYVLRLTATDGGGLSASDTVTVTVRPESRPGTKVAFVAGTAGPPSGDRPLLDRFVALGATVTVIDDDTLGTTDFSGYDLIFLSTSVKLTTVGDQLKAVAKPILTNEQYLLDDMSMAIGSAGATTTDTIRIIAPGNALAAGRNGDVVITNPATAIGSAVPAMSADIIATVRNNAVYFAYDGGDAMADGFTAPAARVYFPGSYATAREANAAYFAMFEAAVAVALS